MITRSPHRSHICLSCQRNLAKRLSSSATQFSQQTEPFKASRSYSAQHALQDDNRGPKIRRGIPLDSRRQHVAKPTPRDGLKMHGHMGRRLQENIESLSAKSLGDTAQVVVLKDTKCNFYTYLSRMNDLKAEHIDIGAQLAKERGIVTPAEVQESIDATRPQPGEEPQTWEDWNNTVDVLSEGFTHSQLKNYAESYPKRKKELAKAQKHDSDEVQGGARTASDILKTRHLTRSSPWMPGVSQDTASFDQDPLRGYYMTSHTAKQKIALTILRICWRLELPAIAESIGQFEFGLPKGDLELLSRGTNSPLAELRSQYLAHEDEGLEIFFSREKVRVTTFQHKMDIILTLIQQNMEKIKRAVIPLSDIYRYERRGTQYSAWHDRFYDEATIKALGKITNTEIDKVQKTSLLVSSLEDGDEMITSTRIDTVKRLLTTVADVADRAKYSLECNTSTEGLLVDFGHSEGLNWWEKLRHWTRWTTPISKNSDVRPLVGNIQEEEVPTKDEASGPDSTKSKAHGSLANTSSWWGEFQETSALFGAVLHASTDPKRRLSQPFDTTVGMFHRFLPFVPNLSRTLQNTNFLEGNGQLPPTNKPLKYITLRFLPDPFQPPFEGSVPNRKLSHSKLLGKSKEEAIDVPLGIGGKVLVNLPPIEMRFGIADDGSTKLKDIIAITSEARADVMLPSNGVDIRFQDRTTRRIKLSKQIETLRDFVSRCVFDLKKGRMITPPSLVMPIDRAILTKEESAQLGLTEDTTDIQYLFAGLEIRSTLAINWNGWRVLYTSIEAGQAGGRRSELRLRPIHDGKVSTKEDFLAAANELALELGDSPPGLELVFGSPAHHNESTRPWGQKRNPDQKKAPKWGVNGLGVVGGTWQRSPALFDRVNYLSSQDKEDLLWDVDEQPGFDIDWEDVEAEAGSRSETERDISEKRIPTTTTHSTKKDLDSDLDENY